MIENYKNLDFEIYVRLHDLQNILKHYQVEDEYYDLINEHMELIRTKRFRVAVIGEFSRGKSSLLNALLGGRILPADITPTTATINRITFDMEERVELLYHDGTVEEIDINSLSEYVTKLTDEGEKVADKIKEAVIYYPTVICQNNISLIDTPGLNEDEKMTKLTVEQLKKIDAAIVLVSALSPVDQIEQSLIESLIESHEIENLLFVVSFIDCIEENDRERVINLIKKRIYSVIDTISAKYGEKSEITEKARKILTNVELYPVSATQALKAMETNKRKLLQESGFIEFQKGLYKLLASWQQKNALIKTLKLLADAGTRLDRWFDEKNERLEERRLQAIRREEELKKYYNSLKIDTKETIRNHILSDDKYLSKESWKNELETICIAGLSEIKLDDEQSIICGLKAIDVKINEHITILVHSSEELLKKHVTECIYEINLSREEKLCKVVEDFSADVADEMRSFPLEVIHKVENFKGLELDNYKFFTSYDGYPYILSDSKLQNDTDFVLSDVRHCNYIAFMKVAVDGYSSYVSGEFTKWKHNISDLLEEIMQNDFSAQEENENLAISWLKNCEDEILVNKKLFEKHKKELSEIELYARETIQSIQKEDD